ncbi:Predicted transcriptional regulator of N-Acetylglucosamine utilization, GntR family [Olavius sp. associated proteobacterium Delta 1]|nr:Predicted transcriptional regulator of N-Acetylglucosamine utilization, GntR family [Olavius sp. associated proteobacterium Delta 1]
MVKQKLKIVDESNPIPKYLQISAWLKELIQTGRYKADEQLPSEVELSKMCGVNRNTLRQAIGELTAAGLLRKEKGTGTFVSSPSSNGLRHKLERISSFTDMLGQSGIKAKTSVISKSIENADDYVAGNLFLGSSKKVVVIRRVRAGNGTPYIYEESYLPSNKFEGILDLDLTGSMYDLMSKHFNVELARSKQTISAVNLAPEIAKILNVPVNSAAIFAEYITYDEKSMPIELLHSYYRGDKYALEIELGRYHAKPNGVSIKAE